MPSAMPSPPVPVTNVFTFGAGLSLFHFSLAPTGAVLAGMIACRTRPAMNRTTRHIALAAGIAAGAALAAAAGDPAGATDRVSLALSWACLLLLAGALAIGPLHALRTGRPLLNHLLRRDLGTWGALCGLAHLALAFAISMTPAYIQSWVDGALAWPAPSVRRSLYFWAVVGSLVIAALFVLLVGLSSNRALALIGARWWKRLQRLAYLAFALTVAHAAAFQVIESRSPWLVALLAAVTVGVLALQLAGRARVLGSAGQAS